MTRHFAPAWRVKSLMLVSALAGPAARADMPLAGTPILNTGEVSYLNTRLGQIETVSTNTVSTLVAERPRFDIDIDQTYVRAPGETALFAFLVSNTGNTKADVQLRFGDVSGDFEFSHADAWIDTNGNGRVDPGDVRLDDDEVIALEYGERRGILVDIGVPTTARLGERASGVLSGALMNDAREPINGAGTARGPDASVPAAFGEVIVDERGLTLEKSTSTGEAASGEELVYTLRLRNNSNAPFDPDRKFDGVPLSIDGVPEEVLIVRDRIPLHTQFSRVLETHDFTAVYQTAEDAPEAWSRTAPADPAAVTAIGFVLEEPFQQGHSRDFRFAVTINPSTDGVLVENVGEVLLPGGPGGFDPSLSNRVVTSVSGEAGTVEFHASDAFGAPVDETGFGDALFIEAVSGQCNISPGIDTAAITVSSAPEGDRETVLAVETAPNSGVFRTSALPVSRADIILPGDGVLQGSQRSIASATVDCDPGLLDTVTIAPAGVVFDSSTNEPVPGALVELVAADGTVLQAETTDGEGVFSIAPGQEGAARLRVTPPDALIAPSRRSAFAGYGRKVRPQASFGQPFAIELPGRTLNIDIPVDPDLTGALAVSKTSESVEARTGDIVT